MRRASASANFGTPARELFEEARQDIMVQAPELDEMVQWSSVVAGDK